MLGTSNNGGFREDQNSRSPMGTPADTVDRRRQEQVQPISATFRNILLVVSLILVFAVVQMATLWAVCNIGMRTASSLEHQGLPTLNDLASLQEQLVTYRLNSYEFIFAQQEEKPLKEQAVQTLSLQMHASLKNIKLLLPEGDGRIFASNLEFAVDELDQEFSKVRKLVDVDFAAAMKAMDQDIPPKTAKVAAAAQALKDFGYNFSGGQANATFGSFGWIKKNAIMFGGGNIIVALGAVVFVLVAARRSRAKLSDTLVRLDEKAHELASSLSVVHATLDATADGIVLIDTKGRIGNYNAQFLKMWNIAKPLEILSDKKQLIPLMVPLVNLAEGEFITRTHELNTRPELESFDVLKLKDQRIFECVSKPHRIRDEICGRVWSFRDITMQTRMREEVEQTHRQLMLASRQAGMAEIATNVLHNVGNVLNSVNVSATVVSQSLSRSKSARLDKAVGLLREKEHELGTFLTSDPRGKQLPAYLEQLVVQFRGDEETTLKELQLLRNNIEHIKEIVAMQQNYARISGVKETVCLTELVEDSLRMNADALARHGVELVREFSPMPSMSLEKHKVLQILVNLLRNAKQACQEADRVDKRVTIRTTMEHARVRISVADNGVGISPENMNRIFNHGFTTRKDGHGFGLHSGALAAKEMGGSLTVSSEGSGLGATFTLELPYSAQDSVKA